jgi:hypothetical protein
VIVIVVSMARSRLAARSVTAGMREGRTPTGRPESEGSMRDHVCIWIDHKKAVIVHAVDGRVTTDTLDSDVAAHPHFGGQQDGGGEKKYEERRSHDLARYYDEVLTQVKAPDGLLILGPGEAKRELLERFVRTRSHDRCRVELEAAGVLTDGQIAAKVREHFSIAR